MRSTTSFSRRSRWCCGRQRWVWVRGCVVVPSPVEAARQASPKQPAAPLRRLAVQPCALQFKAATTPSGPINAPQTASGVLAVFDSSWRAAIAVRAAGGQP